MRTRSLLATALVAALPAFAQAPSPVEADFWRTAQQLGTPDAYRAYLKAFPDGFYAGLAQAAVAKLDAPRAAPAKPPAAGLDAAAIGRRIAEPAASGAVAFSVGDVFRGPGPLTVGWLGAKKQVLLPNGDWIVLAAVDDYSGHRPRIPLAAVAFGQFENGVLRSVLTATSTSRSGHANATWTDVQACEAGDAKAAFQLRIQEPTMRQCVLGHVFYPDPDTWKNPLWESVFRSLARLEMLPPKGTKGMRTRFYNTDNLSGYLLTTRSDFFPAATIESRRRWAESYGKAALPGIAKRIDADDLVPGGAPTWTAALPD